MMRFSGWQKILVLSIALTSASFAAGGKDSKSEFHVGPADTYSHQTAQQITVGAKAYNKQDDLEPAFGKKLDLLKYGVLPVLVVIQNKGKTPLDLRNLEVNLVASDGRHANAVPPDELFGLFHNKPKTGPSPLPFPTRSKKNPFSSPELVTRSFTAKIVPPGDAVSGFLYFEARLEQDDKLYVSGLRDVRSGQELIYFEFPLQQP